MCPTTSCNSQGDPRSFVGHRQSGVLGSLELQLGREHGEFLGLPNGGPPPASLPIAVLYLSGAALMAIGASGVVARLTVGWMVVLRVVVAVVVSPLIFWAVFTLADMICDAIAGPDAGWWWPGDGAILITALIFAAAGTTVLIAGHREMAAAP